MRLGFKSKLYELNENCSGNIRFVILTEETIKGTRDDDQLQLLDVPQKDEAHLKACKPRSFLKNHALAQISNHRNIEFIAINMGSCFENVLH